MNAITVNQAKRELDNLMEQVISNAEPAIICSDKDEKAVLMSLDEFNSWQETLYLLSNPANAEHLRKSIAQVKEGKTIEREIKI
ncbi:MAG: type II toxin-antitoxin system prevent-host-death family antitoxin [bacterium]|nr:type II toxin-antitoxin system prevent-host-death family antitoxin [bacterium]